MKASRILMIGLGLTVCAFNAKAADDSDFNQDARSADRAPMVAPARPDEGIAPVPPVAPPAPREAANRPVPPPAPAEAPPAPQKNRAYYDSSTDRTYNPDGQVAGQNSDQGVRSGTTSAPEENSQYVAPRKDSTPRVHDGNRPTRIDEPSGTTAPGGGIVDPRLQNPLNGLLVDAGLGAGFGMHAPGAVWGLGSEYRFSFMGLPERLAFKGLFDVNFGYGTDLTQFLSIGVGANWYLGDLVGTVTNRAYVGVDINAGDARNAVTGHGVTSAVLGVGGSYTFLHTTQADFNAMIHYSLLLQKLDNSMPSVLTFRVGMAF